MLTTIAGDLIDGHILLSDWLLLIAAIVFVVAAVVVATVTSTASDSSTTTARRRPWLDWSALVAVGLAAVAVALLVV